MIYPYDNNFPHACHPNGEACLTPHLCRCGWFRAEMMPLGSSAVRTPLKSPSYVNFCGGRSALAPACQQRTAATRAM